MNSKVERAFKEADHTARVLGDMKHGIYSLKVAGGMGDKEKMEVLMDFANEAEGYIVRMMEFIEKARGDFDDDKRRMDQENK